MMRSHDVHLPRAVAAGLAASAAYLATNALDMRLLRYQQSDLVLLGRLLPPLRPVWPLAGLVLHTGFGLALAIVYAALARERLPGPGWLRGILLATAENLLLWPLVPLVDRHHPAVRAGLMPPLNRPRPFLQAVLRHLAFGAVLGLVYEHGRRPAASQDRPFPQVARHHRRLDPHAASCLG